MLRLLKCIMMMMMMIGNLCFVVADADTGSYVASGGASDSQHTGAGSGAGKGSSEFDNGRTRKGGISDLQDVWERA